MVDIQTISIAIASASVVAGIIYYSLQIRQQTKTRQTDLVIRLYTAFGGKEMRGAWEKITTGNAGILVPIRMSLACLT